VRPFNAWSIMADHILGAPASIVAAGAHLFASELRDQGLSVREVAWRPPPPDGSRALAALARENADVLIANDRAVESMQQAHPVLVGISTAGEAVPGMDERSLLHAGPPISWNDMSGPLRGAVIGAVIHEGLAGSPDEAVDVARSGGLRLSPCHDHAAVGPMAGVVTASMPVWVVEDEGTGRRAFSTLNEGLGKVLRYGAYDRDVLARLEWLRDVAAPVLANVLVTMSEPIDLRSLIAQAVQMGDEAHNRNRAGTSLFLRHLLPGLISSRTQDHAVAVARFIDGNDHFFLNLAMAAAKVTADASVGIPHSSIVTAMARNGTEFGIRLSGTGDSWFTGPAGTVEGLFLPGFGPADANPDIGDSTITETVGLGGLAMAAAPAIVGFVGGSAEDAIRATRSMYEIAWGESEHYRIPALGFRGTPLGIDAREVVHTGLLPVVNTGIAHREAGIGQIGAGMVSPPMGAFIGAVHRLAGV
jgi:Protein of unknown function (DUF1116)